MRHGTLGAILGLVLGVIATVAYEHYFDLGPEVSQAKSDLASARTDFATDLQKAKSQIDGLTSQLNQVASSNDQLTAIGSAQAKAAASHTAQGQ
jgi:hypothetical protein